MRIKKIAVKKFKNLVDFECEFSESNISAFIGINGAGKSNILELITEVFSEAKNATYKTYAAVGEPDILGCVIDYEYNGSDYTLNYDKFDVSINHNKEKLSKKDMNAVLPDTIMLYYAGETDRQTERANATIDERYDNALKNSKGTEFPGFKYLDCYSTEDLGLLLLVAAIYKGDYYQKLLQLLDCSEISTKTNLIISSPQKRSKGYADTYWGAKGFVKIFLDELKKFATKTRDLEENYVMVFENISLWKETSENEASLFTKLKALKNAGYVNFFNATLKQNDGNEITHEYLSEGEKQLALLYLLTSFTANNSCLYLFDEFDSYLHLNWQRSVSKMLNDINVNGHIIFTTHSPATISQIKSDDLYILKKGKIVYPSSETYNRALDDIMLEQMEVSLRPREVEELYDKFKQSIADKNKEQADHWKQELMKLLDENDPLWGDVKINLRRI